MKSIKAKFYQRPTASRSPTSFRDLSHSYRCSLETRRRRSRDPEMEVTTRSMPFVLFAFCSLAFLRSSLAFPILPSDDSAPEIATEFATNETSADLFVSNPFFNTSQDLFESLENRSDVIVAVIRSPPPQQSDDDDELRPNACDPDSNIDCRVDLFEVCRAIDGGFRCACPEKVSRMENGECSVLDECSDRAYHNCSRHADCVDAPRGYLCVCKDGYRDAAEVETQLQPGRVCIPSTWLLNSHVESTPTTAAIGTTPANGAFELVNVTIVEMTNHSAELVSSSDLDALADSPFAADSLNEEENRTSSNFSAPVSAADPIYLTTDQSSDQSSIYQTTEEPPTKSEPPVIGIPVVLDPARLKDIFTVFDADGNSLISFRELQKAVEQYGIRLDEADVRAMIQVADFSGEGLVDFKEFATLMRKAV